MKFTGRFEGDGREMLTALPRDVVSGTTPIKLRRSAARTIIEAFEAQGASYHSGSGGTVWVIVEHCRTNRVPYVVEGTRGIQFTVKRGTVTP